MTAGAPAPRASALRLAYLPCAWGRLSYGDRPGAGMPLVLLHGTGCDIPDWASFIEAMPRDARIIAAEFRGHGQSDTPSGSFTLHELADDVEQLLAHLGIARAVLLGHSLGGMTAMDLAPRSTRVAGLVLAEGWTHLRAAGQAFAPGRFYGQLPQPAIDTIVRKMKETMARFRPECWKHFWQSVEASDARAFLDTARIPVVPVYGEMGRTPRTEQMLDLPPAHRAAIRWIPDAGHYLPQEAPALLARHAVDALRHMAAGA